MFRRGVRTEGSQGPAAVTRYSGKGQGKSQRIKYLGRPEAGGRDPTGHRELILGCHPPLSNPTALGALHHA